MMRLKLSKVEKTHELFQHNPCKQIRTYLLQFKIFRGISLGQMKIISKENQVNVSQVYLTAELEDKVNLQLSLSA